MVWNNTNQWACPSVNPEKTYPKKGSYSTEAAEPIEVKVEVKVIIRQEDVPYQIMMSDSQMTDKWADNLIFTQFKPAEAHWNNININWKNINGLFHIYKHNGQAFGYFSVSCLVLVRSLRA